MSTTTTVAVQCDICSWTDRATQSLTITEARRAARKYGWVRRVTRAGSFTITQDVCPDCQDEQVMVS